MHFKTRTVLVRVWYLSGATSRNRTYVKALPWPRNTIILLWHALSITSFSILYKNSLKIFKNYCIFLGKTENVIKKEETMDQKQELLTDIYKDAQMGVYTVEQLIELLKEKDNKIKPFVEEIQKKYKHFQEETKQLLEQSGKPLEETSLFAKMGANMHIKKEVEKDNSDANIADMLIQGLSMGSLDMEKKLDTYKEVLTKEEKKLGKEFLQFQQKTIEDLKKYL